MAFLLEKTIISGLLGSRCISKEAGTGFQATGPDGEADLETRRSNHGDKEAALEVRLPSHPRAGPTEREGQAKCCGFRVMWHQVSDLVCK